MKIWAFMMFHCDETSRSSIDAGVVSPAARRRHRAIAIELVQIASAVAWLLSVVVFPEVVPAAAATTELTASDIPLGLRPDLRALIEQTFSPCGDERFHAVLKLREMGERARPAFPFLLRLLQDPDRKVRWGVPWILASLRDRRAVEPLIAALDDTDTFVAGSAALTLSEFSDPRVLPALLDVLRSPRRPADLRKDAATGLGHTGDPRAIDAILAIVKGRDAPPDVRCGALRGLGTSGERRVVKAVTDALADGRERRAVRISAAAALEDLKGEDASGTLASVARNSADDPLVRFWAAIDCVIVTDGAIEDVEVARALGVPPEMLPYNPEGICDEDARYTRLAALHAVAERGRTFAVRSTGRRLLRSIWARKSGWYKWDVDRNNVVYALTTIYFVGALMAWTVAYRRWLNRGQFTLRSLMILAAILALGLGIPSCFDATVPLRFDDPDWPEIRRNMQRWPTINENLPSVGLTRLVSAP
jgi:HEAT repeat protein